MPPYAVSIEKSLTWRGQLEKTANIYHYDIDTPFTTDQGWNDLANAIANIEKAAMGAGNSWVAYKVWGPTNLGKAQSKMVAEGTLTGTGSQTGSTLYPEMAVVVSLFLGRSPVHNRKRFLRKYLHTSALPTGGTSGEAQGNSVISSVTRNVFTTYGNAIKNVTAAGFSHVLCAPNGDHLPIGTTPKVLDYLHVRQLRH